jgi:2-polyprenyl-6-methoxyphenol hydroxylase-like FAD-dependent oxidoreductase
MESIQTTCCVVGGGLAGVMLGFLLARAGVEVVVLEKHPDFFRDFRGDIVHPSTMTVLDELGLLDEFLAMPHQELTAAQGRVGDFHFTAADFSHLPTRTKFIALMPQWDFLNFISDHAKRFLRFQLWMNHEATGLIRSGPNITGVEARSAEGLVRIQADLVVACDGRGSTMRHAAGLEVQELGVPIDVLWFRISRRDVDPEQLAGNIDYGNVLVLINRGDYFQSALIIRKGAFEEIKRHGLEQFRDTVARTAPFLWDRVDELQSWDQIKLLTVQINRLREWHLPGLLCIGDAAHAMSPAGGVGINLAIQDAVATANILAGPLREGHVTESALAQVQQRREFPTRVIQRLQMNAHKLFELVFENGNRPVRAPWQLKVATQVPGLRHVLGRVVGLGIRPEHVNGTRYEPRREWSLRKAAVSAGAMIGAVVVTARAIRG